MTMSLIQVPVDARTLTPDSAWAEGLVASLPAELAQEQATEDRPETSAPFVSSDHAISLRDLRAFMDRGPTSSRLPFNYRRLWGPLRHAIAGALGRYARSRQHSWASFPGWPVDLSADILADMADTRSPLSGIKNQGRKTPVLLTHDIDTLEGLRNLVSMFLPIEESAGARSANYIVPCSWPVDEALTGEVLARGNEIGVHGYDHSNKTSFLPEAERRDRLAKGYAFASRLGGCGYRSPSLVRTQALIDDLAQYYAYDSSIPTSGGLFPVPNNGCASARPWRIRDNGKTGLWEIPLSMPRDGSLRFLGYRPKDITNIWIESADLISRSGGVVNLLTHCEHLFSGNPAMLAAYEDTLRWLAADGRFVFMLPRDLVTQLQSGAHA